MKNLKILLLGFSVLLVECSSICLSKGTEQMYQISQSELTMLKNNLTNAKKELEWQEKTLKTASTSLTKLKEEIKRNNRVQMWKGIGIGASATLGFVGLTALIVYLKK